MLPILEQLLVIQDRDRRIAQLRLERVRIPQEITAVDARVTEESVRLEQLRQDLRHLEAERKKLEIDAESKRAQVMKYRTQLFQIKSNTEYQALLKEIGRAEEEINAVEDQELDYMEQTERLQPTIKEEQALVKDLTGKAEVEKADLQKRAELIEKELAELEADRGKIAGTVDADALARYERVLRSKGDLAIVPVRHENCGGCHLHLTPQLVHDARYGTELTSCEYCGRILYYQVE